MPKNFAPNEELIRRRRQLGQLDADASCALAVIVGGAVSWINFMEGVRKTELGARAQFAAEISCMQAILRCLSDDGKRELLSDGLRNELQSLITECGSVCGTFGSDPKLTPR